MEIWIVLLSFSSGTLSDEVYHRCLVHLDVPSQTRVMRFFHREDSWRSLMGMLLPRALLKDHGIPLESVIFSRTEAGKPFIEFPVGNIPSAVGYNISHDHEIVAMVSHLGDEQDIHRIGIDVMRCALPKGETVTSFLRAIGDTLTPTELSTFTRDLDHASGVRYIFLFWTLKEAYTKALGLGLGFDFKRIEYNITHNHVLVDGKPARGWEFLSFVIQREAEADAYQGAVARWIGGDEARITFISNVEEDWRFHQKGVMELMEKVSML